MVSLPLRNRGGREGQERRSASQWAVAWRRFKKHKSGLLGLGMIVALILVAIFHSFIAPYPARPDPDAFLPLYEGEAGQPPSWKHPFGTTIMGTDVFSELVHGTVYTLYVAIGTTLIAMLITVVVGISSGYLGRLVDDVLMRITEVFLVFPSLLLILVFARIYQLINPEPFWNILGISIPVNLTMIVVIVAVFAWAGNARVIRGEVMALKEKEFIQAAKSLGANSRWIMLRHIFPNILPQVIVIATLTMASAVLIEAVVSFLGFGDPNTITWGRMMEESFQDMSTTWWAEVFPGLAVFFTVLAFNLMGDGISDALNPRLRE
ncbi:MAG: ABC transporter permease [Candidatus Methanosuratincola petrocarbonis]|nr:ABC transporter permease [Candidatus Methanosuratincola sp.]